MRIVWLRNPDSRALATMGAALMFDGLLLPLSLTAFGAFPHSFSQLLRDFAVACLPSMPDQMRWNHASFAAVQTPVGRLALAQHLADYVG